MLGPGAQRISTGFDPLIEFLTVLADSKKFQDPHIHKEGLQNDFGIGKSSSTKIIDTNILKPV